MAFFFFMLSALCGLAVIHPFVTFPASLSLVRRKAPRPLKPAPNAPAPSYAICVCAYNEENVIREKAENLLAIKRAIPNLDVRIYVDCASDGTAAILNEYSHEFFIHVAEERHGKTHGMNLLVAGAAADVIVFTDANVMLDPESVSALEKYFADPEVGCVCGHLIYVNDADGTTAATGSLYWKIEEKIKQLESDTGSVMGADGSIFAIRRALHVPPPADIIDDMFVSFSILANGHRVVRAPDVKAYEQSVTSSGEEFRRKVRIACQAFNVHRLLWPKIKTLSPLDLYKYVSHKLLRWFGIVFIALSALFFTLFLMAAGFGWLAAVLIVLAGGGIWAGLKYDVSPVPQIVDILASFAGTGLGVYKSLRGQRFQTWNPAMSIRKKQGTP